MRISDWSSDVCSSDLLEVGLLPRRGEFAQRHAAFALQPDVDDGEIVLDSRDGALDDMAFEAVGAAERLLEHGREIIAGGVCRSGHKNVVPELTFSGRPVGSGGLVAETAAHAEYGRGIQTTERKRRNRRYANRAREDSYRERE